MKIVVTGASGMLGNQVLRHLQSRTKDRKDEQFYGAEVEGWSCTTQRSSDGLKFKTRKDWASGGSKGVDLVIHCAALTDADYCEANAEKATLINAKWPGTLAASVSRFVYVSTDAVYDDSKLGRRKEDEQPNPLSVYAKTKLEGEGRTLVANPDALVVRTTMFGWTLPGKRPKFAEQILAALTDRRPIPLFRDAIFSPLHVEQLAEILVDLAELEISGVLNVGARRPISKLNFGKEIAWMWGLNENFIEEVSVDDVQVRDDGAPLIARRTKNVGLDTTAFKNLMGIPPDISHGLTQLYKESWDGTAKKIRGREMYP